MGVAPTAFASASVSCLSSSSLLSVKKPLVVCDGHFLTLPSHSNGTKIEMDNDQSYAPQLPVSKAFSDVVPSFLYLFLSRGLRLFLL